jgi:hypothetical protein
MAETTMHGMLEELAAADRDHRDNGDRFERLITAYLIIEPPYQPWPG